MATPDLSRFSRALVSASSGVAINREHQRVTARFIRGLVAVNRRTLQHFRWARSRQWSEPYIALAMELVSGIKITDSTLTNETVFAVPRRDKRDRERNDGRFSRLTTQSARLDATNGFLV